MGNSIVEPSRKIVSMRGMSVTTGKPIDGLDHFRQSIRDVLTTPIGTRVMRRDYGSRIPALVDSPMNNTTQIAIFAAAADALQKWEPRLLLEGIEASSPAPGVLSLSVFGQYLPDGNTIKIEGILV